MLVERDGGNTGASGTGLVGIPGVESCISGDVDGKGNDEPLQQFALDSLVGTSCFASCRRQKKAEVLACFSHAGIEPLEHTYAFLTEIQCVSQQAYCS